MKIKVLASGSKGNCTYIENNNVRFLIDIGISFLQLKKELTDLSVNVEELDFIVLTHTHSDHIKGLKSLLLKSKIKLYISCELIEELKTKISFDSVYTVDKQFEYKDIIIKQFPLSHDVPCYGFCVENEKSKLVYITDTGYLNRRYFDMISNADMYILESNHDEKILMDGSYPYILKQRIIGDKGHLSNNMAASILKKVIGSKTKYVFLAHLSEENNTKELAYEESRKTLEKINFNLDNIIVTDQYLSTEMVEI